MLKKGTISKVREYYLDLYQDIFLRALREFFDRPDLGQGGDLEATQEEENLFTEWLFYDFKMENGKTMLEDFYDTNPFSLSKKELSVYKDLKKNIYGLYKVLGVKAGEGLTLKNIQTGRKYFVHEFSGSLGINKGIIMSGRVGRVGHHYELVGSDGLIIPLSFSKKYLKMFQDDDNQITPKFIRGIVHKQKNVKSLSKEEIIKQKHEIEQEFIDLLEEHQSNYTLGDIKEIIYNEDGQDDLTKIIRIFDRGGDASELDNILELATDAWNYFPHKLLNNRSPMEMRNLNE